MNHQIRLILGFTIALVSTVLIVGYGIYVIDQQIDYPCKGFDCGEALRYIDLNKDVYDRCCVVNETVGWVK